MSDAIITVENLSKRYRLGVIGATTLRESVERGWHRLRGRDWREHMDEVGGRSQVEDAARERPDELWALKDVSFEVKRGEILGLIGKNGAGKSTLLKILTRITEPTEGKAILRGHVASLLEVGTGFHPELTGRENVFLNGAILGMNRREISTKFDDIVEFAEVAQFIDTPVKRYSSGMYVRLAFAVAAHLDPEILLVDEVLAVGDAGFQRRCLGKMEDVAKSGRTVLFVSHNMAAVMSLCHSAHLLDHGQIVASGQAGDVVDAYMARTGGAGSAVKLSERKDRAGTGIIRMVDIQVANGLGRGSIRPHDRLQFDIGYEAERPLSNVSVKIGIYDQFGRPVYFLDSADVDGIDGSIPAQGVIRCSTGHVDLTPGHCLVNAAVLVGGVIADHVGQVCRLDIEVGDFYGTGKLPERQVALCLLQHKWDVKSMV